MHLIAGNHNFGMWCLLRIRCLSLAYTEPLPEINNKRAPFCNSDGGHPGSIPILRLKGVGAIIVIADKNNGNLSEYSLEAIEHHPESESHSSFTYYFHFRGEKSQPHSINFLQLG